MVIFADMMTINRFETLANTKFYSIILTSCGAEGILAHKMAEILYSNANGSLPLVDLVSFSRGTSWESALDNLISKGIIDSRDGGFINFALLEKTSGDIGSITKISLSKKRAEAGRKGGLKAKQKRENREIVTKKVNWLEYSFNKAHVKKMHEGYEILQELSKSGEPCNNSVFRYGGFVDFNFNPVAYIVAKYASVGVSSANDFKRRPNQGHAIHLWVKTFDKIIKAKTETLVLKSVFHNFYMQIVESRFKDGRYNFYAQKFLSLNYYSKTDFNNGNCKYDSVAVAHDRAISIGGNDSKYAQSWFSFLRLVRRVKGDLQDIKVEEERSGFYYSRLNNCYVETKSSVNKDRLKISGKVEPVKDPVKDPVKLMEEIAEVQIKQHVESNPKKEEEPLPYNVGEVDWDKALFGDDNNHEKK